MHSVLELPLMLLRWHLYCASTTPFHGSAHCLQQSLTPPSSADRAVQMLSCDKKQTVLKFLIHSHLIYLQFDLAGRHAGSVCLPGFVNMQQSSDCAACRWGKEQGMSTRTKGVVSTYWSCQMCVLSIMLSCSRLSQHIIPLY